MLYFQIEVEFRVSDGTANTVHSPVINVCACHNQGACVEQASDDSSANNNTQKFQILSCQCLNGYTGSFCEVDLDACEENSQPCFPGVSCIDLPPPANESGYTCGPCSNGYSGNGAECSGQIYHSFSADFSSGDSLSWQGNEIRKVGRVDEWPGRWT